MVTNEYELTPREHLMLQAEQEEARLAREHAVTMKNLELALAREDHQAEIRLKELEAKWATWLKIPKLIVLLPVLIPLGLAYVICPITGYQPQKRFWDLLS